MNIEDERDAFERALIESKIVNDINITSKWEDGKYVSKFSSSKPYTQAMFEVWLAAKAHAEEMRKPVAVIEHWAKYNTYSVKKPKGQAFRNIALGFETKQAAVDWAQSRGYRVIE